MLSRLLVSAAAAADPAPVNPFEELDEGELFRFEEELVTVASRYAQTVRKAPSIVTLVSADEIRERGYRTVSDVLRALPGVYVWRSEEGRDLAAFRGVVAADNNKILVMVDGRPWYDGVYTHGFIDDYLPISNVRQIEVIKGPGSAIYGTNAFAGVVNIVTWRAQDLEGARLRVMGGSTARGDLTASAGGRGRLGETPTEATAYVRLFGQTGDGLDVAPDLDVDEVGTDPRKGLAAGAELGVGGLQLQVHHVDFAHTYLVNGVTGPFDALGKSIDSFDLQYHDTFLDARYRVPLGSSALTPSVFYQRHDNPAAYFFGGDISVDPVTLEATQFFRTVDPEKTTDRWGASVDAELRPALDHVVVAGLGTEAVRVVRLFDYYTDSDGTSGIANNFQVTDDCGQPAGLYVDATGPRRRCGAPGLQNLFAYAQYTWTATPFLELTAGGRFDKRIPVNDAERPTDGAFTPALSPRLGVLLVPTDAVTAKILYGRAFRAPNVRELLVRIDPDPTTGQYQFASGNPQLRPEAINTTEADVTAEVAPGLSLRADGSWSLLVQEIDKVPPGLYCNLTTDLSIWGAEAGVRAERGPIELGADYALTLARYGDARDPRGPTGACVVQATSGYADRAQYEFPPHMGKGSVRWAVGDHGSITAFGELYSRRPRATWSPDAKNPDGEAFGLLHLAARAAELGPNGAVEVGFALRNLLGARWSTGVYRDDANEDDTPAPVRGEGRTATVSIEVAL